MDFTVFSTHQQALTEPWVCGQDSVNEAVDQSVVSSPEKDVLDNAMDVCLQQLSDVQLNEVHTFIADIKLTGLLLLPESVCTMYFFTLSNTDTRSTQTRDTQF